MPRRTVDPPNIPEAIEHPPSIEADAESGDVWQTPPGRLLAAARAEFIRSRGRFLDRDELEWEWEEERLGTRA